MSLIKTFYTIKINTGFCISNGDKVWLLRTHKTYSTTQLLYSTCITLSDQIKQRTSNISEYEDIAGSLFNLLLYSNRRWEVLFYAGARDDTHKAILFAA